MRSDHACWVHWLKGGANGYVETSRSQKTFLSFLQDNEVHRCDKIFLVRTQRAIIQGRRIAKAHAQSSRRIYISSEIPLMQGSFIIDWSIVATVTQYNVFWNERKIIS